MTDICFQCPTCQKRLVVDERGVGLTIKCPDCDSPLKVPAPQARIQCPGCKTDLAVASYKAGDHFDCPNCKKDLSIRPKASSLIGAIPTSSPASNKKLPVGGNYSCPDCGASIPPADTACGKCGWEKAGRKEALPPPSQRSASIGIAVIIIVILCVAAFMVFRGGPKGDVVGHKSEATQQPEERQAIAGKGEAVRGMNEKQFLDYIKVRSESVTSVDEIDALMLDANQFKTQFPKSDGIGSIVAITENLTKKREEAIASYLVAVMTECDSLRKSLRGEGVSLAGLKMRLSRIDSAIGGMSAIPLPVEDKKTLIFAYVNVLIPLGWTVKIWDMEITGDEYTRKGYSASTDLRYPIVRGSGSESVFGTTDMLQEYPDLQSVAFTDHDDPKVTRIYPELARPILLNIVCRQIDEAFAATRKVL